MSNDCMNINLNGPACLPPGITSIDFDIDCTTGEIIFSYQKNDGSAPVEIKKPLCAVVDIAIDKANITRDIRPADGVYVVTIPCFDRVSGAPAGNFELDLSVLFDDINTQNTTSEGLGIDITSTPNPDGTINYEIAVDLCELPAITQTQLDAATTAQVAGCVDGNSVLMPIQNTQNTSSEGTGIDITSTPNPDGTTNYEIAADVCEFTSLTQAQVIAATSVEIAACVDGNSVLIPNQPSNTVSEGTGIDITPTTNPDGSTNYEVISDLCEFTALTQTQIDSATSVQIAGCVDGNSVLFPLPPASPSNTVTEGTGIDITTTTNTNGSTNYELAADVCEFTALTQTEVDAATSVQIAGCVDGASVLFPMPPASPSNTVSEGTGIDITTTTNTNGSTNYEIVADVCEFTALTQTQVDAATLVQLTACVDGNSVLIPGFSCSEIICTDWTGDEILSPAHEIDCTLKGDGSTGTPYGINNTGDPIVDVAGYDANGCSTRMTGACGEQLVFGDDGQLKKINLQDVTFGGASVRTDFDFSGALSGSHPDHVGPGAQVVDYGAAIGETFTPPFDPAAVGLSCYKWVADVKCVAFFSASPATTVRPIEYPMSLRVTPTLNATAALGGKERRQDYLSDRLTSRNHSQIIHWVNTFEVANQAGPNPLVFLKQLGINGLETVAQTIVDFAVFVGAQVTFRLERI